MCKKIQMRHWIIFAGFLFFVLIITSGPVRAAETKCQIHFTMKSWSFFYKSGKGKGNISCDNGQRANVTLRGRGGGLSFGKNKTLAGRGVFSQTGSMNDLFGSYAYAGTHGGAGDSGASRVLTKGDVSLAITGTGEGVNVGIAFGSFKIKRVKSKIANKQ